jgi:hypothetical protein
MAIPWAFRVIISYQESLFKLGSATRVWKVTAPSSGIEGAAHEEAGAWFVIEGAGGRTLYRREIANPFDAHEVYTGEERGMRRVRIPGLPQALSLLVPEIEGGETLVVYASEAPERAGKVEPAKRIFQVSMRDVAALAAKGRSVHGR